MEKNTQAIIEDHIQEARLSPLPFLGLGLENEEGSRNDVFIVKFRSLSDYADDSAGRCRFFHSYRRDRIDVCGQYRYFGTPVQYL